MKESQNKKTKKVKVMTSISKNFKSDFFEFKNIMFLLGCEKRGLFQFKDMFLKVRGYGNIYNRYNGNFYNGSLNSLGDLVILDVLINF